jgi:hypothetical protein
MSFKSMDLMIDVLPTAKFNALLQPPGLVMCTQATAITGNDESDDDDDDKEGDDGLDCTMATQVTTNPPESFSRREMNLSLLRRQLNEALSLGRAGQA